MTDDTELDEILKAYARYITGDWKETDIVSVYSLSLAKDALRQWSERREAAAAIQIALNFGTRLKDELIRRELSSDNLPKGYRKMTNEELITKVYSELTEQLVKQLTSDRTGGGEGQNNGNQKG